MTAEEQQLAREIGLILRRLRLAHGLTQQNLARRVAGGVDTTYIGKIERGDQLPSLKVLLRLSRTLEVSVGDFFYPPAGSTADHPSALLHLEPLLQALRNRGIDGIGLVRAILDAIGQHVLVPPPRRASVTELEPVVRADKRTAIPLPMPQGRTKD
ncbi:MAG TPA: helix-turn-helix transcriptional regulator [Candidatus Tectomicrobia bacterium]|jgi:transcriptional regulator with XRE-family HTH domain